MKNLFRVMVRYFVDVLLLFSHSAVFDSLQPHGLQHARIPWPSQFLEPAQIHAHWVGNAIQPSVLCPSLLLLPSIFPSIRVFSTELALCIRWPKYLRFSFIISPSSEYSGLIFFRTEWFDFLAVQGTLKNLLQHHSSRVLVLCCSAFFMG